MPTLVPSPPAASNGGIDSGAASSAAAAPHGVHGRGSGFHRRRLSAPPGPPSPPTSPRSSRSAPVQPPSHAPELKKRHSSLSRRALKLFRIFPRASSACTVRTERSAVEGEGSVSLCPDDAASATAALGGGPRRSLPSDAGGASGADPDVFSHCDTICTNDLLGVDGMEGAESVLASLRLPDPNDNSGDVARHGSEEGNEEGEEEEEYVSPEAMERAKWLHRLGRRHQKARKYDDSEGCYLFALDELAPVPQLPTLDMEPTMKEKGLPSLSMLRPSEPANEAGNCGTARSFATETDVLCARIRYDLSRCRLERHELSSIVHAESGRLRLRRRSAGSSPEEDEIVAALTNAVRCRRTDLDRTWALRLEGRIRKASDPLDRADLLRALGRVYDERLGEYDRALGRYARALEEDRSVLARLTGERLDGRDDELCEVRRCLNGRIEETKKMIGRLHYKRGQFGLAVRASFLAA